MGDTYRSWPAIAAAIKDTAKHHPGTDLNTQLSMAIFDRFLSRVFSDGADSEWLLKGGTSMLARVPTARATTDVDLAAAAATLDAATDALSDLVAQDLGDHITFTITDTDNNPGGGQPGVEVRGLLFTARTPGSPKVIAQIPVDLVVSTPPVGHIQTITPANRLHLPKTLPVSPYRLYPIVDHIADKVCATMMTYPGGRPSSRVKDLVDLALIARTQTIDLDLLRRAITSKRALGRLPEFTRFTIPDGWQTKYRLMASRIPALADHLDITQALNLVTDMVDPALAPAPKPSATWNPTTCWTEPGTQLQPDQTPVDHGDRSVHVREYTRHGILVREHHRTPKQP